MKIQVDIPETHLRELKRIAEAKGISRAGVIREAIASYLAIRSRKKSAFGLWGNRKVDGLEYQQKLRSE